jgi:ubiquinone/menaquinone biosynthesis C-methylase UbiE
MTQDFYDKVAKKFGNYSNPAKYFQEFPSGAPEEIFKEKLAELSGKDKVVLDSGCGDGRFTLTIAPHFRKIIGNDTSKLMLDAALKHQKEKGIKNVEFIEKDIRSLNYPENYFDIIYARRSVVIYSLFYKILKPGGYFLTIDIGEKDTKDIKVIFGRGQNYGKWDNSVLESDIAEAKNSGFEIVYAKDFYYNEYYLSQNDLDVFLQGVPIFEDYDSTKDKKYLEKYVKKIQTGKGIDLPRHRVVLVAKKI